MNNQKQVIPKLIGRFVKRNQFVFLLDIYFKKIKKNKDVFILLEQDKGFGKSTLAIHLALKWLKIVKKLIKGKTPISYNSILYENIIYDDDYNSIYTKIRKLPNFSPLIFDEGGRIILAEDWNKKENKQIKKLFAEIRTKQLMVIINSPFAIDQIDKKYLTNFIDYWVHLWGFGIATIFKKNLNPIYKGFGIEMLKNILPKYIPEITCDHEYFFDLKPKLIKHPCFYGDLFWDPLPDDIYKEYQKLRDYAVYNREGEEDFEFEPKGYERIKYQRALLIYYLKEIMRYKTDIIADILKSTPGTIRGYLKQYQEELKKEEKRLKSITPEFQREKKKTIIDEIKEEIKEGKLNFLRF